MRIFLKALALSLIALISAGFINLAPGSLVDLGAKIKLDKSKFHFGEVEEGTIAEHIFKITNVGDEPLRILKVEGT